VDKTASLTVIPEPGGPVEFSVVVTNDSVATDPVTLTSLEDDIYGDLLDEFNTDVSNNTCPDLAGATIQPGDSYSCSFTADVLLPVTEPPTEPPYLQTDTVTAQGVDDEGTGTGPASDDATVTIVSISAVTDSSLCDFGGQFRLIFTPDLQALPTFKLSSSNPGQFFYNVLYLNPDMAGETVTFELEVPYPYVTQGANPIHVYSSLSFNEFGCFDPTDELSAEGELGLITLESYDPQAYPSTTTVSVTAVVPEDGFLYVNLHLDYGLEGTRGYDKSGSGNAVDPDNPANVLIPNGADHIFSVSDAIVDSQTVTNFNEFKRFRGFGGLVKADGSGDPFEGVQVEIRDKDGNVISDPDVAQGGVVLTPDGLFTDEDGFYTLAWQHKGKRADYQVQMVDTGYAPLKYSVDGGVTWPLCPDTACAITVQLGGRTKFVQVDFMVE
jgi:hypothetical protein